MPRVGFEPTISAGERPKTYALDRAATGTGVIRTLPIFLSFYIRLGVPSYFFLAGSPNILTQRRTIDLGGWNVHNSSDSFFCCLSVFIEAIHLP